MKKLIYLYIIYIIVFAPVIFFASQVLWLWIMQYDVMNINIVISKDQYYYLLFFLPILIIPYIINDYEKDKFSSVLELT